MREYFKHVNADIATVWLRCYVLETLLLLIHTKQYSWVYDNQNSSFETKMTAEKLQNNK